MKNKNGPAVFFIIGFGLILSVTLLSAVYLVAKGDQIGAALQLEPPEVVTAPSLPDPEPPLADPAEVAELYEQRVIAMLELVSNATLIDQKLFKNIRDQLYAIRVPSEIRDIHLRVVLDLEKLEERISFYEPEGLRAEIMFNLSNLLVK